MSWQSLLRRNFTRWEVLADYLNLDAKQRRSLIHFESFPLNLPLRLAEKVAKGTLDDPILKQFLPTRAELKVDKGYSRDPVGEVAKRVSSKLLHKYSGRVLLVCTGVCAMHCRYCFRRNFDYTTDEGHTFDKEIALIAQDASIHEVILSGGDPLSLSNRTLGALVRKLADIPHITRIRFHTRFPIGIPERVDEGFLTLLRNLPQVVWFVVHVNHPRELDEEILARMGQLRHQGVVLLSQSVLLKGVNDDIETLTALYRLLADHGIVPYYLHQLDRVTGSKHFEVAEEEGRRLVEGLGARLPGYAIPRYVREIPGESSKTPLL